MKTKQKNRCPKCNSIDIKYYCGSKIGMANCIEYFNCHLKKRYVRINTSSFREPMFSNRKRILNKKMSIFLNSITIGKHQCYKKTDNNHFYLFKFKCNKCKYHKGSFKKNTIWQITNQ